MYWCIRPQPLVQGAKTGCTGATPQYRVLPKPVIPLSDLLECLVNTQVFSWWSIMEFGYYFFHFTPRADYLSNVPWWTPSAAPVSHPLLWETSIGSSSPCYVGLWSTMSFHSGCGPASPSSKIGPMSWSFSWTILRAGGSQQSVAIAVTPHTCMTSATTSTFWQWAHSSRHAFQEGALCCESKVVFLQVMNPAGCLSLEFLKTREPG
jgi:hypothetical protein